MTHRLPLAPGQADPGLAGASGQIDTWASTMVFGLSVGAQQAPSGCDVDCCGIEATDSEWRMLRATAVDVAARAAFSGYASDRFGPWEVCAKRQAVGTWPPGTATVGLMLLHQHRVLGHWMAGVPMGGLNP